MEPALVVAVWKRAVAQAERELVRFGCALAVLDIVAALSGCFAPFLTTLLGIARLVGLAIVVPALLRSLAIRHATRPDSDLLKAIAVAVGVAALYLAVRTTLVVKACSL